METKFNFKSQICTTRSQSEALLKLGLKKETADMYYSTILENDDIARVCYEDFWNSNKAIDCYIRRRCIPAWSLHRLIEMYDGWVDVGGIGISTARGVFNGKDNTYDNLIDAIEYEIKWYDFNKEYLER